MDLKATMGAMTGNTSEDIKTLYNYVFQLTEEMRYLMSNLDVTNFNDLGLARYENGRLQVYSEIVEVRASKLESIIQDVEDEFGQLESSITQTAQQIELRVQGVESSIGAVQSTVTQTATSVSTIVSSVGSGGTVTAASIVAAINRSGSSVVIDADHVDISGFVTFSDLEKTGQTTINGSNITTGEIRAINFVASGDMDGYISNSFVVETEERDLVGRIGYQYVWSDDEHCDKLWIRTESYSYYPDTYNPSIKIEAAGGVSIESVDGHGVFIYDGSGTEWMFKGGYLYKDGSRVL
jgi:hypothetical protein